MPILRGKSRQTTWSYVLWLSAKHSHASHSWKRAVERLSASCDRFVNPVISQCDMEMRIIDVCRKVARERKARLVLRLAPKRLTRCMVLLKQYTDTYKDLQDATKQKSTRALVCCFSDISRRSIRKSLRWICAHKIHSETRRKNAIPIFVWRSMCISLVRVW